MNGSRSWRDPITLATIVIAIAAILNLAATVYIGWATRDYVEATNTYVRVSQDSFRSSNRPYVGVSSVGINWTCGSRCTASQISDDIANLRQRGYFPFVITYQNFGTIPAREVTVTFVLKINGETQKIISQPPGYVSVFPGQEFSATNSTSSALVPAVFGGSNTAEIEILIKYKGFSDEQYFIKERNRFDSRSAGFEPIDQEYK